MRAKKGFNIQQVCGLNVIVATGKENMDFSSVISMNESSALLWNEIQGKDFTAADLAKIMVDMYQIDDVTPLPMETAMKDAQELCSQWMKAGLLEE